MDLKNKSKEELINILEDVYKIPYFNIYFSYRDKLDALSTQINNLQIDISGSDDKSFDNFVKLGDKMPKIIEMLEIIRSKIKPEDLEIEDKKRGARYEDRIE